MSYQKIDLVYGVTMSNSEYKNVVEPLIKKALKEISDDDLPRILDWLQAAAKRNAERFSKIQEIS